MKVKILLTTLVVLGMACTNPPSRPSAGKKGSGDSGRGGGGGGSDPDMPVIMDQNGNPIVITGELAIKLQKSMPNLATPRLSHVQWENTVKDLLYLSSTPGYSKDFSPDPGSTFGNNGSLFQVDGDQWKAYQSAAEKLAATVTASATAYAKLQPNNSTDANAIVKAFLKRAYRRPPTDSEVEQIVGLYKRGVELSGLKNATAGGIYVMVATVLQSPNFIYRLELGDDEGESAVQLNPYEIASRLSYAVLNSMPDDELFAAAENGELLEHEGLRAQASRLLDDPRGAAMLKNVHIRGYHLDEFKPVALDTKEYPETAKFDEATFRKESELFVEDVIVKQGKGVVELFSAPYAFVSSKTAAAYEVDVSSEEPKKTQLDPTQRAGLLTQVPFLSNYAKTQGMNNIIKRGHYVTETVLCGTFEGAPTTVDDIPQGDYKTNRERTEAMTSVGACGNCHVPKLNPPGYGLENLGPGGKWRTMEWGNPIDAASELVMNKDESINFDGPVELIKGIVKRPELHQCYAKKLVEALYARYPTENDGKLIEAIGIASMKGMTAKELMVNILANSLIGKRSTK